MKNEKNSSGKNKGDNKKIHNPADEGADHNIKQGTEKDLDESYIDKQEAHEGRGVDNEDTTEDDIESEESGQ